MKYTNISAVILAGGRNTRMGGSDKAMLCVEGRPIIERSISVLGEIFQEIVIVTNDTRTYNYDGVKIIKDEIKNIGPLGGIYTGLCHVSGNAGFFVGCDMPFLHNAMICRQADFFNRMPCDALVAKVGAFLEPLHAIYRTSLKDKMINFINNNTAYSIKKFLEAIDAHYWDLENTSFYRHIFKNLNTPVDFKRVGAVPQTARQ